MPAISQRKAKTLTASGIRNKSGVNWQQTSGEENNTHYEFSFSAAARP